MLTVHRTFSRFQTLPWRQGLHTEKRLCGSRSGSPRPSWTSGPWGNCRAWLTCSWTSRHRKSPHMPTLGSVPGLPGTTFHRSRVVAPRRAEKKWKSSSWTSSRLRRARDAGRSWHCAGRASLSLSGRMRMHDHAQRLAPRSLQLLWFSGRARPLPQTMDVLGSEQSSETFYTGV